MFTVIITHLEKKVCNNQTLSGLKLSVSPCFSIGDVKGPFLCHTLGDRRVAFVSGLLST